MIEWNLRQRYAHVLTILIAIVLLLLGVNFRRQLESATTVFESAQFGVRAAYPQGWLQDTDGDYVFRVRDMSSPGFKTTFQVSVQPVGPDATERNVADRLTLTRISNFIEYGILSDEQIRIRDDVNAIAIAYRYVNASANPFLEGIPTVVQGLDIVTISADQAIIITFRADVDRYEQALPQFEQFLEQLVF